MKIDKPWGHEEALGQFGRWRMKEITVLKGHKTSLQSHKEKHEVWFFEDGRVMSIPSGVVHRLVGPVRVLEVLMGDDDDIQRIENDYGRSSSGSETK